MRDRTEADDIVQGAYNRALLDMILPPMRLAAKACGYAITVHGSLNRDIDFVAVPWIEVGVSNKDALAEHLVGAIRGVTGACHRREGWSTKPHGRFATTVVAWCGENSANLDISVMPTVAPSTEA